MSPDQLTRAIARLELNERVALRLAAGRNLLDNELAAALGVSSDAARDLLRAAIDRVADDVGMSPNETWVELRALTVEDWQATARLARGGAAPRPSVAVADPIPVAEPEPEPAEPEPEPSQSRFGARARARRARRARLGPRGRGRRRADPSPPRRPWSSTRRPRPGPPGRGGAAALR